jgi:LPS sulfotransferase NodH
MQMSVRMAALRHLALSRRRRRVRTVHGGNVKSMRPLRRVSPAATYIICTNPRSGSYLLSDGLASTGLAGNPREWFNTLQEQQHGARWRMEHAADLNYAAYLRLARTESVTQNGIAGVKLHYYQFAQLPKKMEVIEGLRGLSSAEVLSRLFPGAKYIWLTRRDKARQAISFVLASRTDEWWAYDGATPEKREVSTENPEFDPYAIARMERYLVQADIGWQAFFHENLIEPRVIYYEDLASDYAGTILGILKWLGTPSAEAFQIRPARLRRQSNERNEEWLVRYAAFKNAGEGAAPDAASAVSDDTLVEWIGTTSNWIPNAWKRWVGHSKLFRSGTDAIVEVLTKNGYSRAAALAEVNKAASDPYLLGAVQTCQQLRKAASLLNVQGQLARLNSQVATIERCSNLSRNEFRDRYYAANRPVIIQNLMSGWKAMTAWTPDYLKSVAGEGMMEVMTGRNADPRHELNPSKHRAELRFADYVDMVFSGKVTNDYCLVANNHFFQRPVAHPLLQDFGAFPEYLNPEATALQCFLWFGPAGTVERLRHDTVNVLIAQVAGCKRYRLVPASQWQYVYNNAGVFSDVDCENPDLNRHPRFRNATMIDFVLKPGEVLFLPVGWWHHVRALDVSMSVAFTNFVFPNTYAWR